MSKKRLLVELKLNSSYWIGEFIITQHLLKMGQKFQSIALSPYWPSDINEHKRMQGNEGRKGTSVEQLHEARCSWDTLF